MPFVLFFVGLIAITVAVRGHAKDASALLASEFTGSNSFIQWFLAVMILGLVGYYSPVRPATNALLGLVILAMVLQNGKNGLFTNLEQAFQGAQAIPSTNSQSGSATAATSPTTSSLGASSTPSTSILGQGVNPMSLSSLSSLPAN